MIHLINFGKNFKVCNPRLKKQVGLYEVEEIDNPNIITIAENSKEYLYTGCCKKKKKIPLEMFLQNGNDRQITRQITFF